MDNPAVFADSFSLLHMVVLLAAVVYLLCVITAAVLTVRDRTMRTPDKVVMIAVMVIFPIIGLVVFLSVAGWRQWRRSRPVE